ncbi:MAG: hypothetical protein IPL96_10515 [Holophagaceae bacterium]|nr:hypothetical protein [Holophagaceae bacterium]
MPAPSRTVSLSALALCLAGALSAQDLSLGEKRMALPSRRAKSPVAGHDRPDLRADWQRVMLGGDPTPEYLDFKARLARQELDAMQDARLLPAVPGSSSTWVNLGPKANLISGSFPDIDSGRPVGIATHPSNAQIVYLATSGGGVFKCTNADLNAAGDWTWTSVTDSLPASSSSGNVALGAMAMSGADVSGNTLFIGLGDKFDAVGRGLYKTTNGGTSWTEATGLGAATRTYDIAPVSASVVLVGTNDGLKRSMDGGATFLPVTLGGSAAGQVWSVQAFNATELICSRQSGSTGTLWYSSDAGASWTQALISGLAGVVRMTLATSPASTSQAWGIAQVGSASSGTIAAGLLSTTDKGHTWSFVAAPNTTGSLFKGVGNQMTTDGSQGFYNHGLAVDPSNINRVFVGANLALYRTENGGATWDQLTHWYGNRHVYAHADFHTSAWSKTGPSTLFIGNDGGLCIVRNPAIASGSIPTAGSGSVASVLTFIDNRRNRGIASHLVYNIGSTTAASPANSKSRVSLGLQDNGTRIRQDEGSGLENSGTFEDGIGGDGFGTVIHPTNGNLILGTVYYTDVYKSTNGGTTFNESITGLTDANNPATAPFAPTFALGATASPDTVYTWGLSQVYKSNDFGSTWIPMDMTGFDPSRLIRNVTASASNPNAVAVVTSGGTGFVTYNGGTTWTQFGTVPNNGLNMSYAWFDTATPTTLYAASTAQTSVNNHLWKSTNSGATWTAIDGGGFPAGIPVYVVKNDPANANTLLAGTDFGVYRSDNGGTTWARYGQGLPLVAVRDLYIATDGTFVRAATFGRGAWELSASAVPAPTLTSFTPTSAFANTIVTLTGTNFTGVTSVKYNGTAATFNFLSATSIQSTVPVGATTGPITVTTPGGTATSATNFTMLVSPPSITSFTPTTGPVGTPVTITGTNLTNASSLTFNSTPAIFTVDSPTSISTTVPLGATTGPIAVTTPGGPGVGPTFTVTIPPAPVITSFTANPATIIVGASSNLNWTVTGAVSLSISGVGAVTGTSTAVSPASTTTYVLTATNGGGNVTANATVTVKTRDLDASGGSADVLDMAVMSRAYSGPGIATTIPAADLDGDGDVDDNDITLFLAGL